MVSRDSSPLMAAGLCLAAGGLYYVAGRQWFLGCEPGGEREGALCTV